MTSTGERISDATIQREVVDELVRSEIDTRHIAVRVAAGHVLLSGRVHGWTEILEAADIAWTTPGVTAVFNDLHLDDLHPVG